MLQMPASLWNIYDAIDHVDDNSNDVTDNLQHINSAAYVYQCECNLLLFKIRPGVKYGSYFEAELTWSIKKCKKYICTQFTFN